MSLLRQSLLAWLHNPAEFTPLVWQQVYQRQQPIPFVGGLLEVDEALWGSFWQGDVIAPGYALPPLELAYLRGQRLEGWLTEPSPQQYWQQLQRLLAQPPNTAWATYLDESPALCLAYASSSVNAWWLIWLADEAIIAGYVASDSASPGYQLVPLTLSQPIAHSPQPIAPPFILDTLEQLTDWATDWPRLNHLTRLDRLMQGHRTYSLLAESTQVAQLGAWFEQIG